MDRDEFTTVKDCRISKYQHGAVIEICMRKMIVNIISKNDIKDDGGD